MVQTVMAMQEKTPVEETVILADKIYELTPQRGIAVADENGGNSCLEARIEELTRRIEELGRSRSGGRRRFSRSPARGARKGRKRSQSKKRGGQCWYHWKFAEKAHQCIPPCNYKGEN